MGSVTPEEEIRWNVLMRYARRGSLVAECYGDVKTETVVCFQQTASRLTPWDVCDEVEGRDL